MVRAIRNFLVDEERALNVLVGGAVVVMVLGLAVALGAMHWMN